MCVTVCNVTYSSFHTTVATLVSYQSTSYTTCLVNVTFRQSSGPPFPETEPNITFDSISSVFFHVLCQTRLTMSVYLFEHRLFSLQDESGLVSPSVDIETALPQTLRLTGELKHLLNITALNQSDELFKLTEVVDLLTRLKNICLSSDHDRFQEAIESFNEHAEHVQEVCKLLGHVAPTDHLQSMTRSSESSLSLYWPRVIHACQALCFHPLSKVELTNLEVLIDLWLSLYNEIHHLSCAVNDMLNISSFASSGAVPTGLLPPGRTRLAPIASSAAHHHIPIHHQAIHDPQAYLSSSQKRVTIHEPLSEEPSYIPSTTTTGQLIPGHHQHHYPIDHRGSPLIASSTSYMQPPHHQFEDQPVYPVEEVEEIMAGDSGGQAGQWPDSKDNDIVKRAKAMSNLAFSMYQFTQGEGDLKTTQDLFTQAELFADEANMFYKLVRHFTYQVSLLFLSQEGHDDTLE